MVIIILEAVNNSETCLYEGGVIMKNKMQSSKVRFLIFGTVAVFFILLIVTLAFTFPKAYEAENTGALKNDQSISVLQDKYVQAVEKFSSVISNFNKDKQVKYAVVSPDDTSCSAQDLEEEYNKALGMNEIEFYDYLNDLYETDVNYHIESKPYIEDEVIKQNESSTIGSQDEFELLRE